jgi:hypothetical protein
MKKNTIFHFSKNTKKKDRPKIYIIALDIFFIFHFIFILLQKKAKVGHLLGKKVRPLAF